MKNLQAWLRRDGWLLAVLALCVALCAVSSRDPSVDDSAEARIARVLSGIQGAGQVQVALLMDDAAMPVSAVIVADGADDLTVQLRLVRAATTLLHLDASAVEVFKRGDP